LFANVAILDSNLVLFTPKVDLVETRYLTDGEYHVYQLGLATFKAWSQNEKIVHVLTPQFIPLITESSYSFVANSTTHTVPSIMSSSNLTVYGLNEDSQGNIVANLATDSTSTTAQFTVSFYSEYDEQAFANVYFSPNIFIRNFGNGTQQLERKFVIVNHSAYKLDLTNVMLYNSGYVPENVSFAFYPMNAVWPDYYYNNNTGTFYLDYPVQVGGNLTAIVVYNSP
jgi:hypothetical protein